MRFFLSVTLGLSLLALAAPMSQAANSKKPQTPVKQGSWNTEGKYHEFTY